jgi:hypothetical protein
MPIKGTYSLKRNKKASIDNSIKSTIGRNSRDRDRDNKGNKDST